MLELLARLVHHHTVGDPGDDECSSETLNSPLPDSVREHQTLLPQDARERPSCDQPDGSSL
jgi:hypothetical protein